MLIGALAKKAGVSTATINFYVQQGLLPQPRKLNRTRAFYTDDHLERLQLIRRFQDLGYPLHLIKRGFERFGGGPEGLETLKGAGILQPIPPGRSEEAAAFVLPPGTPAVLAPNEFAAMSGLSQKQIAKLEEWGVLRPRSADRYDASDLELAAMVTRILAHGFSLDVLAFYGGFVTTAQALAELSVEIARRNIGPLRARQVRRRDLAHPMSKVLDYMVFRAVFELAPDLDSEIIGDVPPPRT